MSFVPARVKSLLPTIQLTFDVYVYYAERFICFKKAKEVFNDQVLSQMLKKDVKKIFLPREQESQYLAYLETGLNMLDSKQVSPEKKAQFAQAAMQVEAENAEKNLDTEEGFNQTQSRIGKVQDFVSSDPGAMKQMLLSAGVSVDNSHHSATVTSMSIGLASKMKFTDSAEIASMSIAALVHDLGVELLGFPPNTQRENLKGAELKKFLEHPSKAVDQLSGKRFITPRVLKIIMDHEEFGEGMGYPEKKRIRKLPVSSQIFNLCNAFDHYSMLHQKAGSEIFEKFVEEKGDHFISEHLQELEKVLKG